MTTRRTFLNQSALAACALALPVTAEPTITGSQSLKAQAHKRGLLAGCAVGAANLREPERGAAPGDAAQDASVPFPAAPRKDQPTEDRGRSTAPM